MVRAPTGPPAPDAQPATPATPARERAVLALFPLSTGAAVVVTILFVPGSLLWPALVLVSGTGLSAGILAWRMRPDARRALRRRAGIGLVAGTAATFAYDAVRWLLVVATPWTVDPFAALPIFGQLLLGTEAATPAAWIAGTLFHIANGLGFAVGYTLVVRRPGLVSAVVWAMVLELFTILLYPNWLGEPAIGELFSVSVLGHLAYGLTLGSVAIRLTATTDRRHR